MLKVFISYSRDCEIAVKALVEDVEALGHSAWFDQDTSGGQAWWDQVLSEIRECDVFLFGLARGRLILSPVSANIATLTIWVNPSYLSWWLTEFP